MRIALWRITAQYDFSGKSFGGPAQTGWQPNGCFAAVRLPRFSPSHSLRTPVIFWPHPHVNHRVWMKSTSPAQLQLAAFNPPSFLLDVGFISHHGVPAIASPFSSITQPALASPPYIMTDIYHSKPSVPNAWAKGSTNPVTQRPAGTATVNGVTNNQNNKAAPAQKGLSASTKESNTPDRHANDRLSFLFANMMVSGASLACTSCVTSISPGYLSAATFAASLTFTPTPRVYQPPSPFEMVRNIPASSRPSLPISLRSAICLKWSRRPRDTAKSKSMAQILLTAMLALEIAMP